MVGTIVIVAFGILGYLRWSQSHVARSFDVSCPETGYAPTQQESRLSSLAFMGLFGLLLTHTLLLDLPRYFETRQGMLADSQLGLSPFQAPVKLIPDASSDKPATMRALQEY